MATGNGAVPELLLDCLRADQLPVSFYGVDQAKIHPRLPASPRAGVQCHWYPNTPVETLPFASSMFQVVTSQYGVEYGDLEVAVAESARVLRPGGHLQWICHARSGHLARDANEEATRARALIALQLPEKVANLVRAQVRNGRFMADSHRLTAATPAARSVGSGLREGFRISGSKPGAPNGNLGLIIHNLAHLYQHRESQAVDQVLAKLGELSEEIEVHAGRLEALYAAALDVRQVRLLAARLEAAGAVALRALGWLALTAGHVDESIDYYRRALCIHPGNAELASELAQALVRAGKFDQALKHATEAVHQAPGNAVAHFVHASILADCGDFRGAATAYRASIGIDPRNTRAVSSLLELELDKDVAVSPDEARRFDRLLGESGLDHRQRSRLHFGLASFNHRHGKWSDAFAHWKQANTLKHQATPQRLRYVPEHERQRFEIQRNFFTLDFFARRKDWGLKHARPVFIVGLPRTGSTLVEQILAAHPDVEAHSELMYLRLIALEHLPRLTGAAFPDALLQL
ncbi:MAG: tetratricopeptide repeat protein, partial [Xanthomonadaceae bacterium]|nr:tetratricopeptide repeat protein [Xanthomonadaceae bacterium]